MVDDNKKHYFAIMPKAEVSSFLESLGKMTSETIMWKQGQTAEDAETFTILRYEAASNKIYFKTAGSLLAKLKTSSLTKEGQIFFKVNFDKFQYFTSGKLSFDKGTSEYNMVMRNDIFICQQRTNYRLKSSKFTRIQFKIDGEVFEGLDISAGGTSFIIAPSERERFAKEKIFSDCTLRIVNTDFQIPQVKIAGAWEVKDGNDNLTGVGLGIQFVNVDSKLDEELCKAINSEARAEEIRKSLKQS